MVVGIILLALFPTSAERGNLLLSEVIPGVLRLNSLAFLSAGILSLILTPVFSVVTGLAMFIARKEYPYAAASLAVLTILLISLLLALS